MQIKDRLNPVGLALKLMTKYASSSLPDKLGVRKESEQALEMISKQVVQVMQGSKGNKPKHPEAPGDITPSAKHIAGQTTSLLDFNYNETQEMIAEMLADFAATVLRPAAADANERAAMPSAVLEAANALELTAFTVPEALGGSSEKRSPITSRLIIEKLAHGDMGLALGLLSSLGFANAVVHFGTAYQQHHYLKAFLQPNGPKATIALNEPDINFDVLTPRTTAKKSKDGWVLNGHKCLVPMAAKANWILVSAMDKAGLVRLFIVASDSVGLKVTNKEAMGFKAAELADLTLNNVFVTEYNVLGDKDFDFSRFVLGVKAAWCALSVGAAEAVLDYTSSYCNERIAFGEPISHRQAVAFMVANIAIELEAMRVLTDQAVSDLEHDRDAKRSVGLAYELVSNHAMTIGNNGVQLLGGHGYTKEYPVERWYRDMRAAGIMLNGLYL